MTEGLSDGGFVSVLLTAGHFHRGDTHFRHAVAIDQRIANTVEEFHDLGADVTAAGDHKPDAVPEDAASHLLQQAFC